MTRLEEIRARCDAARPGSWRVTNDNEGMPQEYLPFYVVNDAEAEDDGDWFAELRVGDYETADFIAHAREDIPYLLAEVERLTEERNAAVEDLNDAQPCFACAGFSRNGGKCTGGGTCRIRLMADAEGLEYKDGAHGENWQWRGAQAESEETV